MLRSIISMFFMSCFLFSMAQSDSDVQYESPAEKKVELNPIPTERITIQEFRENSKVMFHAIEQVLNSDFDQMNIRGEVYLNRYNNPDYFCILDSLPEFCWCGIDPMEGLGFLIRYDENESVEDVQQAVIQIIYPFFMENGFSFDEDLLQFFKKNEDTIRYLDIQSHFLEEDDLLTVFSIWDWRPE